MVDIGNYKINPSKKIKDDLKLQIIYMPLESTLGYTYEPLVRTGDYVCIGEKIGKCRIADVTLKSSVSGTVTGIKKKYIANGKQVDCIEIENDFKERYFNKPGKRKNISKYSKDELIYLLKECSVTGMGGFDYPTYMKYDTKEKLHYIVVNGAECDAYTSSDSAVMYHYTEEVLETLDAMIEAMDIDKAYIAVDEANTIVIKQLLKYINTYPNIKVYPLPSGYPNGWERNIIKEIFNMTYDKSPLELGIVVNNVSTIYSIYDTLKYNTPVSSRIITITGDSLKDKFNCKVKLGTDFSEIMLKTGLYKDTKDCCLIAGGAMRGKTIPSDELIVTKDLSTVIVLKNKKEESSPCLKCGKCSEVCPVGLMPSLIVNDYKKHKNKFLSKCIECGLCSYVCPAKIEVRDIINKIKEDKNEKV